MQVVLVVTVHDASNLAVAVIPQAEDHATLLFYEEYHPFGSTSYHAKDSSVQVSAKRYRYTGKERDDETGLYYHGARYYSCWLGRWTSSDPSGISDGPNRYRYAGNRPIGSNDPTGNAETDTSNVDVKRSVPVNTGLNELVNARIRQAREDIGITDTEKPTEAQRRELVRRVSELGLPRGGVKFNSPSAALDSAMAGSEALVLRTARPFKTYIEKWSAVSLDTTAPGNKYEGANPLDHGTAWWTGREAVNPSVVVDLTDPADAVGPVWDDNGRLVTKGVSDDKIRRVAIGTDKLGHFFAQGYQLFEIAELEGGGAKAAQQQNEEWESGKYGLATTGVYSHADNAANLQGLRFYQDLYENPNLVFDIADYANEDWNEELNPNDYSDEVAGLIYRNNPGLLTEAQQEQAREYLGRQSLR